MRDRTKVEKYLINELTLRGIEVLYDTNYAGNSYRYFIFKGQRIAIDSFYSFEPVCFEWTYRQVNNMLLVIDNLKNHDKHIYYYVSESQGNDRFSIYKDWAYDEFQVLQSIDFDGYFLIKENRICLQIG